MINFSKKTKQERKKFEMPHTYVLLGIIILFCVFLTYVIPAGQFARVLDEETGKMLVVAGSYQSVAQNPAGFFDVFIAIQEGMIECADTIFFVFFAYGFVYMMLKTGAFDAGIGAILRKTKGKVEYLIPAFMILLGLLGATVGMYEEMYGLIPVFIGIAITLKYDAIVGGAIVVVGIVTGFAAAMTNPFTIGVAQSIAGVPMFSGLGFRIVVFIVFEVVVIAYTMRYAKKVRENPEKSIVKDLDMSSLKTMDINEIQGVEFTKRHGIVLLVFFGTIGVMVFGTLILGWYINEIAATFIISMIIIGLLGGFSFSEIAGYFVEGASTVMFGALVIGLARAILIVMENGMIIDTIVYKMVTILEGTNKYVAAVGMTFVQNVLNFFIPSGSGQAATTMPIMVPIADMLGINRQVAVMAFQFGDGFSNLFWPTAVATECALMGLPINKWYKFMAPLFGIFIVLEVVFMIIAVAINLGPI